MDRQPGSSAVWWPRVIRARTRLGRALALAALLVAAWPFAAHAIPVGASVSYGITVFNFSPLPQTYTFTFSTPLDPAIAGPIRVQSSIVGGLTDLYGTGVSLTGVGALQQSFLGAPLTNMGVDVGPSFTQAGGVPGALYRYGAFTTAEIDGPVGSWTELTLTLVFRLSGNTIASLTGFTSIIPLAVPVPPALPLLVAGCLVLGFGFRRRVQSRR